MNPTTQINLHIPVLFIREKDQVVAYSPVLDLSTAADDVATAKAAFETAVDLFLEDLSERGSLETVLSDLGWERRDNKLIPPAEIVGSAETMTRPVYVS